MFRINKNFWGMTPPPVWKNIPDGVGWYVRWAPGHAIENLFYGGEDDVDFNEFLKGDSASHKARYYGPFQLPPK